MKVLKRSRNTIMKKRIQYIDVAKGIAILCIILGHMGMNEINRVVFTFHVPIFFIITGYFTSKKLPVKEFVLTKARTLLVPYFLTCIVMSGLAIAINLLQGGMETKKTILEWMIATLYGAGDTWTAPFYVKGIGAIWFLWASFWASVFLRIALEMKAQLRVAFVLLLFVAGCWTAQELFWFPFSIQAGAAATLYMYAGYLLRDLKEHMENVPREVKIFGTIGALFVWLQFIKNFQGFWFVHCHIGRGIIDVVGSFCGCYVVLLIAQFIETKIPMLTKGLCFYGKYSLLVLCVHIIELNLFPWWRIEWLLLDYGVTEFGAKIFVIFGKLVMITIAVICCSKCRVITDLFGITKRNNMR